MFFIATDKGFIQAGTKFFTPNIRWAKPYTSFDKAISEACAMQKTNDKARLFKYFAIVTPAANLATPASETDLSTLKEKFNAGRV